MGAIKVVLTTKLEIEIETEKDLQMILKNIPAVNARPMGFIDGGHSKIEIEGDTANKMIGDGKMRDAAIKRAIIEAIEASKTRTDAAKKLGVTRATFGSYLSKYHLRIDKLPDLDYLVVSDNVTGLAVKR